MTDPTISTKDHPGTYDAFETAKPGEPIFTLQGGDQLAPLCVMVWAWKARKVARALDSEKARVSLLRKAKAAEEVAWAMKEYQSGDKAPPEVRSSYADEGVSVAGAVSEDAGARAKLIGGVGSLNNAIGITKEVEEMLVSLGRHTEARERILSGIDEIKAAASLIEPRRSGDRS